MTETYKIIGTELSPYSVKVRAYFRFKDIPHEWMVGFPGGGPYKDRYRISVVPLVITPEDEALQDSTPIVEKTEAAHPDPSIHPTDTVTRFISDLLEEFGDEWGNKWMFHYRWARDVDARSAAWRAALLINPQASEEEQKAFSDPWVERMQGRVWFVGSNEITAPQIEAGFQDALAHLDAHLATRSYLLGGRPSFGDFGLWPQIYNAWMDPTLNAIISNRFLNVQAWVQRMLWARVEGDFEAWDALEPTLGPFIAEHVGKRFLPWSVANAKAIQAEQEEFTVDLPTGAWTQKPQKYHAKSLVALREKYAAIGDKAAVDGVLERLACLRWLKS